MELEMQFDPREVIERLCAHHKAEPVDLLSSLLKALGRYRLFGDTIFPDLTPNKEVTAGPFCVGGADPATLKQLTAAAKKAMPDTGSVGWALPNAPNVYSEIQGYMVELDPPASPTLLAPKSLLDAVMLAVDSDRQTNTDLAEDMMDDSNPDSHEWCQGWMLNHRAHGQHVMSLVMQECINQIEAMALEREIAGEKT